MLARAANRTRPKKSRRVLQSPDEQEEITDFVQSIPVFQECDEDVETWMTCIAEDCGFQMLNDDEIVTRARRI
ncbi:UNVERIFIED_CONTAM: hypothetical protein NCL1_09988 [Trichonephila clavipes]